MRFHIRLKYIQCYISQNFRIGKFSRRVRDSIILTLDVPSLAIEHRLCDMITDIDRVQSYLQVKQSKKNKKKMGSPGAAK